MEGAQGCRRFCKSYITGATDDPFIKIDFVDGGRRHFCAGRTQGMAFGPQSPTAGSCIGLRIVPDLNTDGLRMENRRRQGSLLVWDAGERGERKSGVSGDYRRVLLARTEYRFDPGQSYPPNPHCGVFAPSDGLAAVF